jgi:hypothetical protein
MSGARTFVVALVVDSGTEDLASSHHSWFELDGIPVSHQPNEFDRFTEAGLACKGMYIHAVQWKLRGLTSSSMSISRVEAENLGAIEATYNKPATELLGR